MIASIANKTFKLIHHQKLRSPTPRKSLRHASFSARLWIPVQWRVDHLGALADWSVDGQSDRTGLGSFLRVVPDGLLGKEEHFWHLCGCLCWAYFHTILCEVVAGAFGGGVVGWVGMVSLGDGLDRLIANG
jgi:hypothetical protein